MAVSKLCLIVISPYERLHLLYKVTFVIEPDLDLCSKVAASVVSYVAVVRHLSPESCPFAACMCLTLVRARSSVFVF